MSPVIKHLAAFAALFIATQACAQDPGLRPALETSYRQWRAAIQSQDAKAWAASITMYRQVVTRNQIVSQGQAFPQAVFSVPLDPPEISGLRLLEAQAAGETAHLLYFGRVNIGGDPTEIPDNILMLKFFQERGGWKFDSSKLIQMQDQPDLRKQLQQGGKPGFLDYPQFTPPGKAPTVPPICSPPQHVAGCTIQSHGYETRMTVNGFEHPVMLHHSQKLFITGGLNNGANEIVLNVQPTEVPDGAERLLQVDLFIPSKDPGQRGVRVYHYESKEPKHPAVVRQTVLINPEVLANGR